MSLKDIPRNAYDGTFMEQRNMAHPVLVFTVLQPNLSQGTKSKPNTYENKMFRGYLDIRGNKKQCSRISHEVFRSIHHHHYHHTLSRRSAGWSTRRAWDKRLEQYLSGKSSKKQLEMLRVFGKELMWIIRKRVAHDRRFCTRY